MTSTNTDTPPPGQNGYGKSAAAVVAGSGCTLLVLIVDYVLTAYGKPPIPAELTSALTTFVTTAAVFFTPHTALGGS